jgi:hypothetical protein
MTPRPNQLRPTKGWRKPPAAVIVPRPARWTNQPLQRGRARPGRRRRPPRARRHDTGLLVPTRPALPRRRAPGGRQPQAPTRKALTPCDGVERPLPHHRPALPQPAHGRRAPLQDARRIRIQPSTRRRASAGLTRSAMPIRNRPRRPAGRSARRCTARWCCMQPQPHRCST